jgi:hypothetical protein
MPGVYRPRHPERTALYRVLFHHFEQFVAEYKRPGVASWANYSNRGKGDMKKRYYGLLGVAWWRIPKRQEDKVRD